MSVSADRMRPEAQQAGIRPDASAYADDRTKSKKQLLQELVELRFRHRDGHYIWIQDTFRVITDQTGHAFELVGAWADITKRKFIETELIGTRQRLQYLLSVNPSIIYTTKASGDYACTFVSENLRHIMGYSPIEMITDPKCWPDHLHPDDAARVIEKMAPLIEKGGGTLDYRFR